MKNYTNPHFSQIGTNQYFQLKYKDLNLVMIFVFRCGEKSSCSDMRCDSMKHRETVFKVKRINPDDTKSIIKNKNGTNKIKFHAKELDFKDSVYQLDILEFDKIFNIINENWIL